MPAYIKEYQDEEHHHSVRSVRASADGCGGFGRAAGEESPSELGAPGGDFVPEGLQGINYKSPGYRAN